MRRSEITRDPRFFPPLFVWLSGDPPFAPHAAAHQPLRPGSETIPCDNSGAGEPRKRGQLTASSPPRPRPAVRPREVPLRPQGPGLTPTPLGTGPSTPRGSSATKRRDVGRRAAFDGRGPGRAPRGLRRAAENWIKGEASECKRSTSHSFSVYHALCK